MNPHKDQDQTYGGGVEPKTSEEKRQMKRLINLALGHKTKTI